MEELTKEEINRHINASFDSVMVINNAESSEDDIHRNISHIEIMLSKDWFANALTKQQLLEFTQAINVLKNE